MRWLLAVRVMTSRSMRARPGVVSPSRRIYSGSSKGVAHAVNGPLGQTVRPAWAGLGLDCRHCTKLKRRGGGPSCQGPHSRLTSAMHHTTASRGQRFLRRNCLTGARRGSLMMKANLARQRFWLARLFLHQAFKEQSPHLRAHKVWNQGWLPLRPRRAQKLYSLFGCRMLHTGRKLTQAYQIAQVTQKGSSRPRQRR